MQSAKSAILDDHSLAQTNHLKHCIVKSLVFSVINALLSVQTFGQIEGCSNFAFQIINDASKFDYVTSPLKSLSSPSAKNQYCYHQGIM